MLTSRGWQDGQAELQSWNLSDLAAMLVYKFTITLSKHAFFPSIRAYQLVIRLSNSHHLHLQSIMRKIRQCSQMMGSWLVKCKFQRAKTFFNHQLSDVATLKIYPPIKPTSWKHHRHFEYTREMSLPNLCRRSWWLCALALVYLCLNRKATRPCTSRPWQDRSRWSQSWLTTGPTSTLSPRWENPGAALTAAATTGGATPTQPWTRCSIYCNSIR